MRIALGIQYDGSDFFGWQMQCDRQTIQQTLKHALLNFTALTDPITPTAAGRTDRGVHALMQIIHFDTALERKPFSWVRGLNAFLPKSIAVQWAKVVPNEFHARFSALERSYIYLLYVNPTPLALLHKKSGWLALDYLDLNKMQTAAQCLIGVHDFSALRSAECQAKSPIKHLYSLDITRQGCFFIFRLSANAFLHHMVRNIIGCLLMVGKRKKPVEWLSEVLASKNRIQAAPTFMPDGLYLSAIKYPEYFDLPQTHALEVALPFK